MPLPKTHRMLNDNGHFCILWMAWLPDEDEIANATEELILKYNPAWTGGGVTRSRQQLPEWSKPLFTTEQSIIYDIKVPFTRENWHGRIKACRGMGASSLPDDVIREFEREHLKMLSKYPETFDILHYVSILNLKKCN